MDDEVRHPRSAGSMAAFARLAPSLGPMFAGRASAQGTTPGTDTTTGSAPSASTSGGPSEAGPAWTEVRAPRKATAPFVASDHRPDEHDAKFRVVLVGSGAREAAKVPSIVGSLCRDSGIEMQVVATPAGLRFFDQACVEGAVRHAFGLAAGTGGDDVGVRVWTDEDEWASLRRTGRPLHAELARWADLVVVAPCCADTLAKVAAGFSDTLGASIVRALTPNTPVILCPSMSAGQHAHPFTAKHAAAARELGHVLLGPQTGPPGDTRGAMADWRDIVIAVQDMAALFRMRQEQCAAEKRGDPRASDAQSGYAPEYLRNRPARARVAVEMEPVVSGNMGGISTGEPIMRGGAASLVNLPADGEGEGNGDGNGDGGGDGDGDVAMDAGQSSGASYVPDASLKGKERAHPHPPLPSPFNEFRPIWGEVGELTPTSVWPVPGLPSTREREYGKAGPLGPKAADLLGAAGAPMQFSSSDHWRIVTGETIAQSTTTTTTPQAYREMSKRWWL